MFDGAQSTKDFCWEISATARKQEKLAGWSGEVKRILDRLDAIEDHAKYDKDMARIADAVSESRKELGKLRYELAEAEERLQNEFGMLMMEAEKDDWRA